MNFIRIDVTKFIFQCFITSINGKVIKGFSFNIDYSLSELVLKCLKHLVKITNVTKKFENNYYFISIFNVRKVIIDKIKNFNKFSNTLKFITFAKLMTIYKNL